MRVSLPQVTVWRSLSLIILLGVITLSLSKPIVASWHVNRATISLVRTAEGDEWEMHVEVLDRLKRASQLAPASASPTRLLLRDAINTGDVHTAAQLLESPSFSWDQDYLQALSVGALYWRLGERDRAEAIWQRAVRANPMALKMLAIAIGHSDTLFFLPADAEIGYLLGRISSTALQYHKLHADVYVEVGRAFWLALHEPLVARDWFEIAEADYPRDAGILYHLYGIASGQKDYNTALRYLDKLAFSYGRSQWIEDYELHFRRGGILLLDPERSDDAIREFEKAVELAPTSSHTRLWLGLAYEAAGRKEDALRQLAEVLQLEPEPDVNVEWVRKHMEELGGK